MVAAISLLFSADNYTGFIIAHFIKEAYFAGLHTKAILNEFGTVNTTSYKTFSATPEDIDKKWILVDAEDIPLGRLASQVATWLRGKHKPTFTPSMDTGDNVVVINAEKIKLTGNKWKNKKYFTHTGYIGSEKFTSAEEKLQDDPTFLVTNAVKGMLPKNKLRNKLMTNLRVYAGPVHPHEAQQPEKIEL